MGVHTRIAAPLVLLALLDLDGAAAAPKCKKFSEIYTNGPQMCEKMWGDSYVVELDDAKPSYTMQWFEAGNPNDAVTSQLAFAKQARGETLEGYDIDAQSVEICSARGETQARHRKVIPGPVDDMGICTAYSKSACCTANTTQSDEVLQNRYGRSYRWDRCGKLSFACERFFVAQACFHECDPNAALFRVGDPADGFVQHPLFKLPLNEQYCTRWFDACKDDLFCAAGEGSVQRCALEYRAEDEPTVVYVQRHAPDTRTSVFIVLLGLVGVGLVVFIVYLVWREKQGKPIFYTSVPTMSVDPAHELAETSHHGLETTAGDDTMPESVA